MKAGVDHIGVSVGTVIFNHEGKVFLSKRSQKANNERGCWEFPGGKVDYGETLLEAVKREVREEFGIEIEITEQMPAHDHILAGEGQHWVATTFIARLQDGSPTPAILEPDKCDEIGWFDLHYLPQPLSQVSQQDLSYLSMKK